MATGTKSQQGYYTTKHYVTQPVADGYLCINDPYDKKVKQDGRILGKQLAVGLVHEPSSSHAYMGTPYMQNMRTASSAYCYCVLASFGVRYWFPHLCAVVPSFLCSLSPMLR